MGGHARMVAPHCYAPADAADAARRRSSAPHLLDVAPGRWLDDRRILVADGRVEAILRPGEPAPDDAVPVVRRRPTGSSPGSSTATATWSASWSTPGSRRSTTSPAQEALSGVRNARDTLRAGFTTVRDVGTFWAFVDVALRDAIDAGWTPGPRMQCAGAFITCPGGGGDVTGDAPSMGLPDGLRFGVVRDAGRGARAGPGADRRRRRASSSASSPARS